MQSALQRFRVGRPFAQLGVGSLPQAGRVDSIECQLVAEVVESERVSGPVSDVRAISGSRLFRFRGFIQQSAADAEPTEYRPQFLEVPAGQITVGRGDVNAFARQRLEVGRKGDRQSFPFAGLHFGDGAAADDHAGVDLHVEKPHSERLADRLDHARGRQDKEFGVVVAGIREVPESSRMLAEPVRCRALQSLGDPATTR